MKPTALLLLTPDTRLGPRAARLRYGAMPIDSCCSLRQAVTRRIEDTRVGRLHLSQQLHLVAGQRLQLAFDPAQPAGFFLVQLERTGVDAPLQEADRGQSGTQRGVVVRTRADNRLSYLDRRLGEKPRRGGARPLIRAREPLAQH